MELPEKSIKNYLLTIFAKFLKEFRFLDEERNWLFVLCCYIKHEYGVHLFFSSLFFA